MQKTRKVIFLNRYFHPDLSATSQILSDLAFSLPKHGLDARVITSRQRYDDPSQVLPPEEKTAGVTVLRVWSTRFGRQRLAGRLIDYLTFYAAASWRLWRLARRGDVIVVKTDPPLMSVPAALIAGLRRAHLVNWLQDVFPEVAQAAGLGGRWLRLPFRVLRRLRNLSLRHAAINVVIGKQMAGHLRKQGIAEDRIHVIPNWQDGAALPPLPHDKNPLRQAWRLQDKFVVGYAGNLGRTHDLDTPLLAARRLKNRTDIVFVFVGGGAQLPRLQQAVQKEGLTNVFFRPYQPREILSQVLGLADVHLVSLRPAFEGLIVPSKIYGVAAAGRPSIFIGDPKGEIAQLVLTHCCGLVVPSGDGDGLADAIIGLAHDKPRRDDMGRRARRMLREHFDKPLALSKWQALLDELNPEARGTEARTLK